MSADGLAWRDGLERAVDVAREDDVDDVLRHQSADFGAIESTNAIGPSRRGGSIPTSSRISRPIASISVSPEWTPPPGSSQTPLPRFSCRHSTLRRRPAQERRDPDSRLCPHHGALDPTPDEPNPAAPRSLSGSSSTSTK